LFARIPIVKSAEERQAVFETLAMELDIHAMLEERLVYPRLASLPGMATDAHHSLDDHAQVRRMVQEIECTPLADPAWMDRCTRLLDCVAVHVGLEEQHVFPAARAAMSEIDAQTMARALHDLRGQLTAAHVQAKPLSTLQAAGPMPGLRAMGP
jgi:hemerythrin superfamily protein